MSNLLIINSTRSETRVALVEDGLMAELHIERTRERGIVGNIYKGKIIRVLPGMQAAFVDISHERAGFLHANDVYSFDEDIAVYEDGGISKGRGKRRKTIQESLKPSQEILVQVAKEPISTKGARLTSHISLPGRYVVFMPTVSHIGISKRIGSEKERRRLRKVVEKARPDGTGFIVRTVSAGISEDKLTNDMEMLIKLWGEVLEKHNRVKAPYLLYEEPNLVIRSVRDLVSADIEKIIIDSRKSFDEVNRFIKTYLPAFEGEVEHYDSDEPIFDAYGIEVEIERSLEREVPLSSGGSIVIDRSEALTAIDVNTGGNIGSGNSSVKETILQTNLEAADEVAYQVRLRNIGGLIIVDFIDMENMRHRDKVLKRLQEAFSTDRVPSNVLAISEFGLVEMTRKRTRESLQQFLCEPCENCSTVGYVKTKETVAYEIIRNLKREGAFGDAKHLRVRANTAVVDFIHTKEKRSVSALEEKFKKKIIFKGAKDLHISDYKVEAKSK